MPVEFLISALVTLVVVVDPIGLVPSYLAITHGLPQRARRNVALRAALIAAGILAGSALIGAWLLHTLSIGLPIGLCVALAWMRRDRPSEQGRAGLGLAVAGGVVGAWLGYHAGADLLAAITAIIGAGALSNAALVAIDIRGASASRPLQA